MLELEVKEDFLPLYNHEDYRNAMLDPDRVIELSESRLRIEKLKP